MSFDERWQIDYWRRPDAVEGDWTIRGVKGEFYPCKPDVFAATYDIVSEPQ